MNEPELVLERIQSYLCNGGLFNSEYMEHDKVWELLMDCREEITKLSAQGPVEWQARIDALTQERNALHSEYHSRALWIEKMNKILGYDNSDGFHSRPDPFELAEAIKNERDKLKETIQWIASQKDLFFAECSQAEEIVLRCKVLIENPSETQSFNNMKTPKYKTYSELAAAFKSGELPTGYYIMLDKGGCENSLNFYDPKLSDEENEKRQEACSEIFDPPWGVEPLFEALGVPCQWC